jgi:hypothetical protein
MCWHCAIASRQEKLKRPKPCISSKWITIKTTGFLCPVKGRLCCLTSAEIDAVVKIKKPEFLLRLFICVDEDGFIAPDQCWTARNLLPICNQACRMASALLR